MVSTTCDAKPFTFSVFKTGIGEIRGLRLLSRYLTKDNQIICLFNLGFSNYRTFFSLGKILDVMDAKKTGCGQRILFHQGDS